MEKEELITWFKENKERVTDGYIAAYRNKYEMLHIIDSQFMDLQFGHIGVSDEGFRFLASDRFPASYSLDLKDIVNSTKIVENDNCLCFCKYRVTINLKRRNIFVLYFNLKEGE